MNINDQQLARALKLKFGTAPSEPNELQLSAIKRDIQALHNQGRILAERDLFEVVQRHCPGAGTHGYLGADNSDLVTLLRLATNSK